MMKSIKNKGILSGSRNDRKQESGAIMLEVIAVLSLMALMGTMLFRQIYLRNQELSNIQMASQIRVVKEAFGAWIQANPLLTGACVADGVARCEPYADMDTFRDNIETFLPMAYASKNVLDDYDIYLRCELIGGPTPDVGYRRCYGMVIPTEDSLPEDWNFKRAARVAALTGIDGGVYGVDVTPAGCFVGSMGSWELCGIASFVPAGVNDLYMAMTAIDVFQPELAAQSVPVNLPRHIDIALEHTQVYGHFVAGLSGCYTPHHQEANLAGGNTVSRDDTWDPSQKAACKPAFYVEPSAGDNATGNVRVLNDLSVGYDYDAEKSNIRFDKNGMIVFENATANDPQNSDESINYVLDPKYTSVLNDVKIMSRGGARLSEILPNYILKEQREVIINIEKSQRSGKTTVDLPSCPTNYKKALVFLPTRLGSKLVMWINNSIHRRMLEIKIGGHVANGESFDNSVDQVEIEINYVGNQTDNTTWVEEVHGIAQGYCVFDPSEFLLPQNKRGAVDDDAVSMAKTEEECRTYGGDWMAGVCTHKAAADIP